ncbi:MAG: hypothetical protein U0350_19615 [Caldilineaceae bacterium]
MLRPSRCISSFILLAGLLVFAWTAADTPGLALSDKVSALSPHRASAFDLTPLQNIEKIATGGSHTCVLTTNGVKCWGYNKDGELGDGTTTNRLTPVNVVGLGSGVSRLFTGGNHTCALMTNDDVKCWGDNLSGQLGDGTFTHSPTPLDVVGLDSGVSALATGWGHTCALLASGGVKCWGYNFSGQLGDGTTTTSQMPVDVMGLDSGVSALATGWGHTCALLASGGVKCWGDNFSGQLGDGTTTNRPTPVDVAGLGRGVSALAAGAYYTCALMAAPSGLGGIKCWGYNSSGQLGDGTTSNHLTPVDVVGLGSGVSALAVGAFHTCALTGESSSSGGIQCWGDNLSGQLGDGTTSNHLTPLDVVGLSSGVSALAAGWDHTCALTTGDGVKCWGNNYNGQLGDGTTTNRLTPVDVTVQVPTPPTPTPTVTLTNVVASISLPLIVKSSYAPKWQPVGQAGLNAAAFVIQGDQLWVGERKDKTHPGGLYQRSLATCTSTPALLRVLPLDSSLLGLAVQGAQGVAAAFDLGMFYTADGGNTWTQSASNVVHPRSVVINNGRVYAGTESDGLHVSEDGGVNWVQRPGGPQAINVLKAQSTTVWIGDNTTGVWKLDGGDNTLLQQNGGLNNPASKTVWDFDFDANNTIYLATAEGVYRGNGNLNSTWEPFDLQLKDLRSLALRGDQIYAGVPNSGIWRRPLVGGVWKQVRSATWNNTTAVPALLSIFSQCQGLLAATNDGVWLYR